MRAAEATERTRKINCPNLWEFVYRKEKVVLDRSQFQRWRSEITFNPRPSGSGWRIDLTDRRVNLSGFLKIAPLISFLSHSTRLPNTEKFFQETRQCPGEDKLECRIHAVASNTRLIVESRLREGGGKNAHRGGRSHLDFRPIDRRTRPGQLASYPSGRPEYERNPIAPAASCIEKSSCS